jgi:glycosyltransferase involved in cell wall biosynthesis
MKLIFYAPYNMSEKRDIPLNRAPRIRCHYIYKALKERGDVFLVSGNSKERKEKYKTLLAGSILNEIDGLYMESANWPLWEHDIRFLKRIKKKNIPMSLFYRDIHWRFPELLKSQRSWFKFKKLQIRYQIEFRRFQKLFDIIYSPTEEFARFAGLNASHLLPPAAYQMDVSKECNDGQLNILFAGAQKPGFSVLLQANEWLQKSDLKYEMFLVTEQYHRELGEHMSLFHSFSDTLIRKAHVGIVPLADTLYHRLSFPFRFMEYLGFGLPVISQKIPSLVRFNDRYHVCQFYDGSTEDLVRKIRLFGKDRVLWSRYSRNAFHAARKESWDLRAEKILADFSSVRARFAS